MKGERCYISHAKSAEGAELHTLLLTLALEGSQLHATEGAEMMNVEGLTLKV